MCKANVNITGPQGFIDPGYMHTIALDNLRSAYTDTLVNIIAHSDMGVPPYEPGAKSTIDRVWSRTMSNNITATLHVGDMSFAEGLRALWDFFMTQIEPTASRIPYMVGIGNHEYDHIAGGEKDSSGASRPGGFRSK